jgi:hypothetical protein
MCEMAHGPYYSPSGLPIEITTALELIGRNFKGKTEAKEVDPFRASMDFGGGHGSCDTGMVFSPHLIWSDFGSDYLMRVLFENSVFARVSYGQSHKIENDGGEIVWDGRTYNRLHISVKATRTFVPDDSSNLRTVLYGKDRFEDLMRSREIRDKYEPDFVLSRITLTEGLNFSLRWVDGKFQGFFGDAEYLAANLEQMWRPENKVTRTSVKSNPDRIELITRPEEPVRKKQRILLEKWHQGGRLGFAPTLELLAQFSDCVSPRDVNSFGQIDYVTGINYVFEKLLPAAESYVRS